MHSQTSLVAEQTRLAQWASDIKDCQNRPNGMKIDDWCAQHGITKANYYYRLRRVREACLASVKSTPRQHLQSFRHRPVHQEQKQVLISWQSCVTPMVCHWKYLPEQMQSSSGQ